MPVGRLAAITSALAAATVAALASAASAGAALPPEVPPPFDATWAGDGIANPHLPNGFVGHGDIATQPDGKIVVVGQDWLSSDTAVVRFQSNGVLDPSFGDDGIAVADLGEGFGEIPSDIAVQGDGHIVVSAHTGQGAVGSQLRAAVGRLRPEGKLDATFGGDGVVHSVFGAASAMNPQLAVQADGRVVLAAGDSSTDVLLARYLPDGTPDRTFGVDGQVQTTVGSTHTLANDLDIDGRGALVVTVWSNTGSPNYNFNGLLLRYLPDGALDASFDGDGIVIDDLGVHETLDATAVQPDGRIVSVGARYHLQTGRATASRRLPDGSLDPSFSGDGRQFLELGVVPGVQEAHGVAVLRDGRIAVTGTAGTTGTFARATFATVLLANGRPDSAFDAGDGVALADLGPHGSEGGHLTTQADGGLVIYSTIKEAPKPDALAVTRLLSTTPHADLAVTLTATPSPVNAGDAVTFTATVRNDGPSVAEDVELRFEASQATGVPRTSQGTCTQPPPQLITVCTLGSLRPGATATVSLPVRATGTQDLVRMRALATGSPFDPDFDDNQLVVEVPVNRPRPR